MPQMQGYVHATWQDMTEVFGEPEKVTGPAVTYMDAQVRWRLDGGTIVHDWRETRPLAEVTDWRISGWSAAAVDQVIGVVTRAGRFGCVVKPRTGKETVHVLPAAEARRVTALLAGA
jgi:hypothetical protein